MMAEYLTPVVMAGLLGSKDNSCYHYKHPKKIIRKPKLMAHYLKSYSYLLLLSWYPSYDIVWWYIVALSLSCACVYIIASMRVITCIHNYIDTTGYRPKLI